MAEHSDQSVLMSEYKRKNPDESVPDSAPSSNSDKATIMVFKVVGILLVAAMIYFLPKLAKESAELKASHAAVEGATLVLPEKLDLLTTELRLLRQAVERMEQRG